jgi:hypothetical protein
MESDLVATKRRAKSYLVMSRRGIMMGEGKDDDQWEDEVVEEYDVETQAFSGETGNPRERDNRVLGHVQETQYKMNPVGRDFAPHLFKKN